MFANGNERCRELAEISVIAVARLSGNLDVEVRMMKMESNQKTVVALRSLI
jgi:hypothetical protein